jgi:hypothetical protein
MIKLFEVSPTELLSCKNSKLSTCLCFIFWSKKSSLKDEGVILCHLSHALLLYTKNVLFLKEHTQTCP